MSKITANDVANFFIDLANSTPEDDITNLKVNKLLYFAQGWSLSKFGKPLFSEDIQAWKYGPVVKSIFTTFHTCGNQPIQESTSNEYVNKFSTELTEFLIDIYNEYGKYTAGTLTALTHEPDTPWSCHYDENVKNIIIPKDDIKKYFDSQEPLPSSFSYDLSKAETIGYRDSYGHFVLPKEDDE